MEGNINTKNGQRESVFLNEHFMAAACAVVVVTGLIILYLIVRD